ncbi:hypothetical protein C8R44DRAFT_612056 [Mycena epipterygia]|nr:hypothetical protein C8R44DRAFT_612056 [Mycena epipterygia]
MFIPRCTLTHISFNCGSCTLAIAYVIDNGIVGGNTGHVVTACRQAPICHSCGSKDHLSSNCPTPKLKLNRGPYRCGSPDHLAANCSLPPTN